MDIDALMLLVLISLLTVNSYIAFTIHRMAQIAAAYKKQNTSDSWSEDDDEDDLFEDAKAAALEVGKCSTSLLQRKFRIGYGRAARLIDLLAEEGIIEWHATPSPGRWVVSEAPQSE